MSTSAVFTFCFHAQMVGKITFLPSYKNGHRMTSRDIAKEEVSIFTANAEICI